MDEEIKKDEQTEPTNLEANETDDKLAKANDVVDRQERANRELARLLEKQEAMKVDKILGGSADVTEPKSKEESPEEYAKKVMANDI